jgi:hypothetical protein
MKVVSTQEPLKVLFLCTGNSARSQMAEVILNRLGAGKFRAFSAGSQPAGYVHPMAVQMLRNAHYDTSRLRSKGGKSSPDLTHRRSISFSPFATTRPRRSVRFGRVSR